MSDDQASLPAPPGTSPSPATAHTSPSATGGTQANATGGTPTKLNKRKTIIGAAITLLVLGIVFLGLIPKIGNYSEAWDSIKSMPTSWLVSLIMVIIAGILVYVWPYQAAIPGLRYGPAFIVRQTSFTLSNAVPAGGAVGLAVQYAMLATYRVEPAAATAGIAITSVWSVFMTLGLPILGVLALALTGQAQQQFLYPGMVGVALITGAIVIFWLILKSEKYAAKVGYVCQRAANPAMRRFRRETDVTAAILHFRAGIVEVVKDRWKWITGSNVIVVIVQYLVLYASIRAVGGNQADGFNILVGFAAFALSRLASMIPVTPGGLGTVDAALIGLLVGFGLDQNVAVAADLVWRAASFIPQVLLGVATFIWWRAKQQRLGSL